MFYDILAKTCLVLFKKLNKAYQFRYHKFIYINEESLLIDIKFIAKNKESCFPLFINCLKNYLDKNRNDFKSYQLEIFIEDIVNHKEFIEFLNNSPYDIPVLIDNDKISDGTVINIKKQSIYYVN